MLGARQQVLHHPVHDRFTIVEGVDGFEAEAQVDRIGRAHGRPFGKTGAGHADPVVEGAAARRDTHRPGAQAGFKVAFYLGGADPYREDQLGGLDLSIGGLRVRDEKVINILRDADVPVATTTAGGYAISKDDTVEIHSNTVRVAKNRLQSERKER